MAIPTGSAAAAAGVARSVPPDVIANMQEASGIGTWVWDPTTNDIVWSNQVHRIFGTDPDTEIPTFDTYVRLLHPDDRERLLTAARETVRTGGVYAIDHRIVCPDGELREVHSKVRAEIGADGAVTYLGGSIQDVTAELRAARELAHARDLFAGVLDAATEQAIIGMDRDGVMTVFNRGAERMLGYAADELIGSATPVVLHDPDELARRAAERGMPADFQVIVGRAADGSPETSRWTFLAKDGHRCQVMVTASAMRDDDGQLTGFIEVATDLTARAVAESALQDSEALFQDIFDNVANGIVLADISDRTARIIRVNPAMTRITGYSEQQLLTMTLFDLTHPASLVSANERMQAYSAGDGTEPSEMERRWVHADGRDIWVELNVSATRRHRPRTVVAVVDDITARKLAEDRLSHLALHDALTGLPNRRLLMDRLQHALDATARSGRPAGVLYVDLDGFKAVNDQAGHLVGDEVLQEVAQRLATHVRPGDTVARMGGDEFVVVCPELVDADAAWVVARRLLQHLAEPYRLPSGAYDLSASIGIASSALDGRSAHTLVRQADAAMYSAKTGGRNRIGTVDHLPD